MKRSLNNGFGNSMMLSIRGRTINFADVESRTEPFDYFVLTETFGEAESFEILDWLETSAPWKLVEADFYTQYEFDFEGIKLPERISFLYAKYFLDYLIEKFEDLFLVELERRIDLTAHKLTAGHTIRLHNDFLPGQETHRFIVQLNRGWRDENGGFLILFSSPNPSHIHRVIRPVHNSAVGFTISEKSNHAVSTVHEGERYTLVYSFYAVNDNAD